MDSWLRRAALLALPLLGLAVFYLRTPKPSQVERPRAESVNAVASGITVSRPARAKDGTHKPDTTADRQKGADSHAQAAVELPRVGAPDHAAISASGFALSESAARARPGTIDIELLDGTKEPPDTSGRWLVPEELQQEIEKRSETEFVLSRRAIGRIFEHGPDLLLGAQFAPIGSDTSDTQHGGLRVESVLTGSLFEMLGLEPGDLVLTLAGQACSSLEVARSILERARYSERFVAGLERRGQRFDLDLRVR